MQGLFFAPTAMANWYYFNKSGEKIGPITSAALKAYAQQGHITPETIIESETGRQVTADKVQGLGFSAVEQKTDLVEISTESLPTQIPPPIPVPTVENMMMEAIELARDQGELEPPDKTSEQTQRYRQAAAINSAVEESEKKQWSWFVGTFYCLVFFVMVCTLFGGSEGYQVTAIEAVGYKATACIVIALWVCHLTLRNILFHLQHLEVRPKR